MYTKINATHYAGAAIAYVMDGHGHNGQEHRNVCLSTVGMLPESIASYANQMAETRSHASSRMTVEARRIIISYSKAELQPDDPAAALVADQIAQDFVREAYPGHQAVIATQRDGKGGCLHTHVILCNANMYTHKGVTDEQKYYKYVEEHSRKAAEQYIDVIDKRAEKNAQRITQTERALREDATAYIWKDDLRDRITSARQKSADFAAFQAALQADGVSVEQKKSKKYGNYYLYELQDISGFGDGPLPPNLRSRSYRLGDAYGPDALWIDDWMPQPSAAATPQPESAVQPKPEPAVQPVKPAEPVKPVAHAHVEEEEDEDKAPKKRRTSITWNGRPYAAHMSQMMRDAVAAATPQPEPAVQPKPEPAVQSTRRLPDWEPEPDAAEDDWEYGG